MVEFFSHTQGMQISPQTIKVFNMATKQPLTSNPNTKSDMECVLEQTQICISNWRKWLLSISS